MHLKSCCAGLAVSTLGVEIEIISCSGVIENLIQRLPAKYTLVIVTHNPAQARRIASYPGFFGSKTSESEPD
jgi:ABC-type phosphate transport system ATPase subunit